MVINPKAKHSICDASEMSYVPFMEQCGINSLLMVSHCVTVSCGFCPISPCALYKMLYLIIGLSETAWF